MSRRVHGDRNGEELATLGLEDTALLDFSVNLNPLGPAPSVLAAVRHADPVSYPDATGRAAAAQVATWLDRPASSVVVGAGAAELIWASVRAFVPRSGELLVVGPTFSEADAAAEAVGARVHEWRPGRHGPSKSAVTVDLDSVADEARDRRPAAIYLCNPNNPTGQLHDREALTSFFDRVEQETDAVVLLDEAFLTLSIGHRSLRAMTPDHVVRLRSLTKDHAIAGVRAAYLTATPDLASRVQAQRAPWSTSSAALAAIVAACTAEADEHVAISREQLFAWRDALQRGLQSLGVNVYPSDTLFLLASARSDIRNESAQRLRLRLLRDHHIIVRDCTSFGLPDHVRVCARPPADVARLIEAWGAR